MRIRILIVFVVVLFGPNCWAQISDTIFSIPQGVDRIDTIRFEQSGTIKFIEFIGNDKVIKRLFYYRDGKLLGADYYDEIGRTIWSIVWFPDGSMEAQFYNNYHSGKTWYENGAIASVVTCTNDTVTNLGYYESGKLKSITKERASYDSTLYYYYYSAIFCENGRKISEEFSGINYTYRSYYCNGDKRAQCNQDQQRRYIGKYREWHANGKVAIKGQFADSENTVLLTRQGRGFGQKEGKWKYYDENGKLIKVQVWNNGKLVQ